MKILADASLPELQTFFKKPFELTLYKHEREIPDLIVGQDVLLCRSTLKVNADLLVNSTVRFVGTASSGIDHIDEDYLRTNGITLIDAKGSNAQSVTDYVLASVAYLQQQHLLLGKQAAVIGVGAVGQCVSASLEKAGFQVILYDPPRALREIHFHSASLQQVLECDLLCIHANLHHKNPFPSYNMFHQDHFAQLKKQAVIINASRGGILNEGDLLSCPSSPIYCTDVYLNEPNISDALINYATLCTPHIAGHSIEAKRRAVMQVAGALYGYANIPFPVPQEPVVMPPDLPLNWQKKALFLYNPQLETQMLKQSEDRPEMFLRLRRLHQFRHDFNWIK